MNRYRWVVALAFLVPPIVGVAACAAAGGQDRAAARASNDALPSEVIWFHTTTSGSLEALRTALSSGLVTHVILKGMHRYDMSLKDHRVRDALAVIREFKHVKLIWSRNLWPYYRQRDVTPASLTDADYYMREVRELRKEGKTLRADFTALDTEPYADAAVQPVMRGKNVALRKIQPRLRAAIQRAVERVGQVDYVYPAGMRNPLHPYNTLAQLGKRRIAELTYYDNPARRRSIKFPYDIPGFFVNTHRENKGHPALPFFTPNQVFLRRELWQSKDAVFYYVEKNSLEVARALVEIGRRVRGEKP